MDSIQYTAVRPLDIPEWAPEGLTGNGRAYGPLLWLALLSRSDHRRGDAARDVVVKDEDLAQQTGIEDVPLGLAALERGGWINRTTVGRRRTIRIYPLAEAKLRRRGASDAYLDRVRRLTAAIAGEDPEPIPLPRVLWPSPTYIEDVWSLAHRDRKQAITLATVAIVAMSLAMSEKHGPLTWQPHELRNYVATDIRRMAGIASSDNMKHTLETLSGLGVLRRAGTGKNWRRVLVSRPRDIAARLRDLRGKDAGELVLKRLHALIDPRGRFKIVRSYHDLTAEDLDRDAVTRGMAWLREQGRVVTRPVRVPNREKPAIRIDVPIAPLRADDSWLYDLAGNEEADQLDESKFEGQIESLALDDEDLLPDPRDPLGLRWALM